MADGSWGNEIESGKGQAVLRPVLEDSHHWRRGIAARPFAPFVLFRGNCTAYLELKCYSSDNACC